MHRPNPLTPPATSAPASETASLAQTIPASPSKASSIPRPADRAMAAAQIGTWEWRLHTQRMEWSPEADTILGLSTGSFDSTFQGFLSRIHHADRAALEKAIQTALADRQPYHMEHRILLPDGTIRWVSCRGRAITEGDGDVCGMAGTVEEITPRKEADLALRDLQQTLEQRVRERTSELEQTVRELEQEIARRQQTDAALTDSEQRYHALYEHNPSMYFTLEADGTILSVNGFGAEELGYRPNELIGQSVLCVFQPNDHQTVLGQLIVCSENPGKTFYWEIQKIRKDGRLLWVRERARAITDPRGRPMILVVCEDVTEHRRTEDAMREGDARLRATTQFLHTLVRESPLPIVSLDAQANVTSWNPAATAVFGWTEQEVLGRELPYVPPGQEADADALWEQGTRETIRGPLPLRRVRKDGTAIDVLLWPVFVPDNTDKLATAVGLYVDQSDLRRAEAARLHSEERLRSFLDALDDLAFEFDDRGTCLNVWTRNEDALLLPKEEIIGNALSEIHGEKAGAHYLTVIQRVLISGEPESIEYTLALQGQLRHFSAILSRISSSSGAPATVACVVRDVTQDKQIEESLREINLALSNAMPGIARLNLHGQYVSVNQYYASALGCDTGDLLGRSWVPTIHPDDLPLVEQAFRLVASQGKSEFEARGVKQDGTLFYQQMLMVRIDDVQGRITGHHCFMRDITDRKQAELALKESEQAIRELHEAASAPGLTFDQRMETVLKLGCRRFKLPIGALTNVHEDQLELTHIWAPGTALHTGMRLSLDRTYCGATLKADTPLSFEHASASEWRTHPGYHTLGCECYIGTTLPSHQRIHGTICFMGPAPYPSRFSQADKSFLLLMARWVSGELDRQASEQALRLSEERFEIAFRSSPHPVIITELDTGRCLEVNDTALRLFGFHRHEAVGRSTIAIELWPKPEDRERFVTQLLENGTLRGVEFTFQTKDRRLRHCLVSCELIALNGLQCILTVGTDVTEKKEAEAALRESEERWHRFVADAPVGLVVVNSDKQILSANKAFCALTGYSEQEVINNTYARYTHPDDLPKNLQLTEEFFSGQRDEYSYEKRYVRKTGEIIWVSVRANRLTAHGHDAPLLLAIVEDITDRKQALADRERISQDLHDNILQSLYAVGMQLEAGKLLIGKAPRKSKQHVTQAIQQLNHLVMEVRQFISGLTRRTAPALDFSVALHQLVSSSHSDGHGVPIVEIDEEAIAAITPTIGEQLLNITREALSNSMRHASAAHRSVTLTRMESHIHLRISDDGVGFETGRKRRRGHGLANMAARARTIRAQFILDSAPGHGTCITIDVPTGGPHVR